MLRSSKPQKSHLNSLWIQKRFGLLVFCREGLLRARWFFTKPPKLGSGSHERAAGEVFSSIFFLLVGIMSSICFCLFIVIERWRYAFTASVSMLLGFGRAFKHLALSETPPKPQTINKTMDITVLKCVLHFLDFLSSAQRLRSQDIPLRDDFLVYHKHIFSKAQGAFRLLVSKRWQVSGGRKKPQGLKGEGIGTHKQHQKEYQKTLQQKGLYYLQLFSFLFGDSFLLGPQDLGDSFEVYPFDAKRKSTTREASEDSAGVLRAKCAKSWIADLGGFGFVFFPQQLKALGS